MLKIVSLVISAAAIAGALTVLTTPGAVDAGPLAKPAEATLKACVARPWPYLNCVGTSVGNPRIRLITTDRVAP